MTERKQMLRAAVRQALLEIPESELRRMDAAILRRVLDSGVYRQARRVFCYYSMGREISTRELIADAMNRGKPVALPVSKADGTMDFYRYTGRLRPGLYGIMEPEPTELLVPAAEDLIIVPGLCYDRTGYRLGRGGGYYDRYLARHQGLTIGLCRTCVLQEVLPREWNDLPVGYVFTDNGLVK